MSQQTIDGRTAFVTGANRGIGRAIVQALLERGAAKVYAGARRPESVQPLVDAYGERVVPVELDVTDKQQVRGAAAAAPDVDLLVNNAGILEQHFVPFGDEGWSAAGRKEFEVNTIGTMEVTQAFAPVLAANGGGAVVNVVSMAGLVNFPMFLSYSASKAAQHSLTQGMRILLAGQGTSVYGAYPGPVDTDMGAAIPFDKASAESVAEAVLDGLESGTEEIFTDPMAQELGGIFVDSPKGLERQIAAMASEGAAA